MEAMFVLLSTAPEKDRENATEGGPAGIYPHGWVPYARLCLGHCAKVSTGSDAGV
jgi:hypothetical protein